MENTVLMAIFTMSGLSLFFSIFLGFADKFLRVEENPLIAKVNELLPGANCGGCGFAGCYDFATKVVEGKVEPSACSVNDSDNVKEIGALLGKEVQSGPKLVARIMCKGGKAEAVRKQTEYHGPKTCLAMHVLSGGDKLCFYGCLGGGDCVNVCPFQAMFMNSNGLPVVIDELCTGCGICVQNCPRNIIELHPIDRKVFVFCKNQDDPRTSAQVCKVACTGCSVCARKLDGAVKIENNLAFLNYEALEKLETVELSEICKTGALSKLKGNGNFN
ncbi:electron transporter RnfB [Bacteroidetes/Chlorobi group bacterium Naka2016]|jgi:Na+-translocating ferredoxin:NAD+ oxidoreductase RNF subunit RnfB|nr:MAG: electron transporter RnfB [Bacteroidetes/Chlorobi group bacterium Naka2016]